MIAYKILLYDNNAEAEAVMSNSFWLSANTLLNIHHFQIWAHLLYQLNRKVHLTTVKLELSAIFYMAIIVEI